MATTKPLLNDLSPVVAVKVPAEVLEIKEEPKKNQREAKGLIITNKTSQALNILISTDGHQHTLSVNAKRSSREVKYLNEFSSPQLLSLVAARNASVQHT